MKVPIVTIVLLLFLTGCAGTSRRAVQPTDNPWFWGNGPEKERPVPERVQPAVQSDSSTTLNVVFRDAPLEQVLQAVVQEYGKTLLLRHPVTGRVTVNLKNANIAQALDFILTGTGFGYIIHGDLVQVLSDSDPITRVIHLQNARATELQPLLSKSDEAKIIADPRTNDLIIRAAWGSVKEIENTIRQLDVPVPQVQIQAEMIEINSSDIRNLGMEFFGKWQKNGQTLQASSPFHLDPLKVLLNYGSLKHGDVTALIAALENRAHGRLLSSPRIVTMSGRQAHILIGERVPYTKQSSETMGGALVAQVEFVDVGIKLAVTPIVNLADNTIVMDVKPEVSEVTDQSVQGVPRISTQEAQTRVEVKDGETVVIGGLMKENKRNSEDGIPFLQRLFLLKYLFSKEENRNESRELIVFITPHILNRNYVHKMGKAKAHIHERLHVGQSWNLFK